MTQLIWLRSDLRAHDNTALAAAMEAGPTLALYVITPSFPPSSAGSTCRC